MKFRLEIELGNEAMQTLANVARSFAESVNGFSGTSDPLEPGDRVLIRDMNGNTVGKWEVIDDQPARVTLAGTAGLA